MVPSFLIRDRDRIAATHVCRHWRDTFLSTPALWDAVPASHNPDKTIAYLERSGDVPLKVSIVSYGPESAGWVTSFRVLGQHSHRFRDMRLYKYNHTGNDVFVIMKNHLPHLTELDINIPMEEPVERSQDPHLFPSMKSLILHGDMTYLRWFQLANLRKLGVDCYEWGFHPPSLLEHLAKAPLLEELELSVYEHPYNAEVGGGVPPVSLKRLQRIVVRGTLPHSLRSLISHIIHPHNTKFLVMCYLPGNRAFPISRNRLPLPQAAHLPILTPPKYIRYQLVHDKELSETRTCIDLISADGRHILIENRYGWPENCSLSEAGTWDLDEPCLEFLQTIDLFSVERLCFGGCFPNPRVVEELLGAMGKLETLVLVDCDPHVIFMGMQSRKPPKEICPLLRRLVVHCGLDLSVQWFDVVQTVRNRAAGGCPLEQVTITSSFSELLERPGETVELLEEITEVRYDLGRNTVGWEWWKE